MAKKKYYVVWKGRQPGIYSTWKECEEQVKGYSGASFKSFPSKEEAEAAFSSPSKPRNNKEKGTNQAKETYIADSISVDAGSHGNPGIIDYKGVDTSTGAVLFERAGIKKGTNNMGEFVAIVHALDLLKQENSQKPIYTDSQTAISWVKNIKVNTTLARDNETQEMWELVDWAINWLKKNRWENPLLKWDTKNWGEIKADYGRKK
ncbi:ribonuclease H [Salsuginibacillus kocurii]|uniref:ribonuclease H n=1 Tax=Salsuginibacillus kocurii TaxID=427078 RepID=UPI000369820E|nr:ribonuclease H family protein [Salsuginibacillus kocurii]